MTDRDEVNALLRPHPPLPMWSNRWIAIGPLFGWVVGVQTYWLTKGGWWTAFAVVAWVLAVAGLVWWVKWVYRANQVAVITYALAHSVFAPVTELGATVTIRPGGHPEVPGEVIVDLPPKENDG